VLVPLVKPEVSVIQGAFDVAVQEHKLSVTTVKRPLPPASLNGLTLGETT
jgi:hypothetical protein